jgi:hypothetical protein
MYDTPLMPEDLHEELRLLDRTLRETRRRAHNPKAQRLAIDAVRHFAELRFPTGLGGEIDKALIDPAAEAILLYGILNRAQRNPLEDVDAMIAGINRFLQVLRWTRAELLSIRKQ